MGYDRLALIFALAFAVLAIFTWSVIGFLWVMYLDAFGKRPDQSDYRDPYPFTCWQIFKAGPLMWSVELFAVFKRKGDRKK